MIGLNTAFGINIDPIFGGVGFEPSQIAILGICVVFVGVLSSMINGVLLRLFKKYLLMVRVYCWGTGILMTSLIFVLPHGNILLITVMMVIGAVFLVPTIPIGIAFANELSYPMDETIA